MKAEVIAIGDELTAGLRLDTNSPWLSQRLAEIGLPVRSHTTVADELDAGVAAFREAIDRADVIVATGGLGPTADDLTRQVLAEVTGRPLVLDDAQLEHIKNLFASRSRTMPERNQVQAMFPQGSRPIDNPHGTAPGIHLEVPRSGRPPCRVYALPGVPAEMREMWYATLAGEIASLLPQRRVICHRRLKCYGVGESQLEAMLPDLIRRGREPSVGITVSQATITLRVTARADSVEACLRAMEPTVETIRHCLGSILFGEEDDELQHAVARRLNDAGRTLAVAEIGTAGVIARWLGDVAVADPWFLGGVVAASRDAMACVLEVSDASIGALAESVRRRFSADYALAVGELPPVESSQPSPKVQMAVATPEGTLLQSVRHAGHPEILKPRAAKEALNLLRLNLPDVTGT